jgi:3-isopropylmalate/(R)-2-methylmalate dehydratase small subunit
VSAEPFRVLRSRAVLLLRDDIDTDQIIPARFLTTTERTGLGRVLFADWRLGADGASRSASPGASPSHFPLDAPGAAGAQILVAGRNFGCGSSREHAPWALMDWGFRAVVAESFGDIFRNNAHKNGLLTVALGRDALARLAAAVSSRAGAPVTIDLPAGTCTLDGGDAERFEVDPFVRHCLTGGIDEFDYLVAAARDIAAWERVVPRHVATNQ